MRALSNSVQRIDPAFRVVTGDADPQALARHVSGDFWHMPETEKANLPALIDGSRARGITTILPTRDGELMFWANAQAEFAEAGISVIVSPVPGIRRCLDKLVFAEWGAAEKLPIIPAARDAEAFPETSLVVKERFGAGARKIGLNLVHPAAKKHAAELQSPIFQPWVPGPEISIDLYLATSGKLHGLVLRHRNRVVAGESKVTTTFRDADLERQATTIAGKLGLRGPAVMQAIVTPEGLAVIEVNARFGGASTASLNVGLDLLFWALLERYHPARELPQFRRKQGEVCQVRIPEDIVQYDPDF